MSAVRFALVVSLACLFLAASASPAPAAGPAAAGGAAGPAETSDVVAAMVAASISYQGYLTDAGGAPLSGAHDLLVQLWDDPAGGTQVGGDIALGAVSIAGGVFSVELPVEATDFSGQALWLRVGVDGEWLGPRQPLLAAPYALGLRPGAVVAGDQRAPSITAINQSGTGVGAYGGILGLDALGQTGVLAVGRGVGLEAQGMTGVLASGDVGVTASGLVGVRASSELGRAVEATSGSSDGVYGESNGGYGVHGTSHFTAGVYGETSNGFASGVEGRGPTGVFGSGGLVGVSGYSEADGMTGVQGTTIGNGARGVRGIAQGYGSSGVTGEAQFGVGVQGEGEIGVTGKGTVGTGVMGEGATGVSGTGLAAGVMGSSTEGVGVWASSAGYGADHAALRANNDNISQGMAAYFTNASTYANTHMWNTGSGDVLLLQSNGGRFMAAVNNAWDAKFRLEYNGNAYADGSWSAGGADFAEMLPAVEGLRPGDVLAIGADGTLRRSDGAFATTVAGVYSARPGFVGGQSADGESEGAVPLAVVGVVLVNASAENGPIAPGDLLVTAALAGHAMRAGVDPPQGTVIGKALEPLGSGTRAIRMLASLQ